MGSWQILHLNLGRRVVAWSGLDLGLSISFVYNRIRHVQNSESRFIMHAVRSPCYREAHPHDTVCFNDPSVNCQWRCYQYHPA